MQGTAGTLKVELVGPPTATFEATLFGPRPHPPTVARALRTTDYGIEYIGEVLDSRPLTPTCHGIRVERHPEFDFEPVQFTFLSLKTEEADDWSDYRSMSLASSPTRDHLEYGARLSDSAWKQAFAALDPGDEVMVEGPAGHFILDETRPAILLAGGIGITPLKGMAEYAADKDLDIPVTLVYSNRTVDEIAYRDELETLAEQNPRFEIVHTITGDEDPDWEGRRGRIDEALCRGLQEDQSDAAWYVCGTPGMVKDMVQLLRGIGVDEERVLYEQFKGY